MTSRTTARRTPTAIITATVTAILMCLATLTLTPPTASAASSADTFKQAAANQGLTVESNESDVGSCYETAWIVLTINPTYFLSCYAATDSTTGTTMIYSPLYEGIGPKLMHALSYYASGNDTNETVTARQDGGYEWDWSGFGGRAYWVDETGILMVDEIQTPVSDIGTRFATDMGFDTSHTADSSATELDDGTAWPDPPGKGTQAASATGTTSADTGNAMGGNTQPGGTATGSQPATATAEPSTDASDQITISRRSLIIAGSAVLAVIALVIVAMAVHGKRHRAALAATAAGNAPASFADISRSASNGAIAPAVPSLNPQPTQMPSYANASAGPDAWTQPVSWQVSTPAAQQVGQPGMGTTAIPSPAVPNQAVVGMPPAQPQPIGQPGAWPSQPQQYVRTPVQYAQPTYQQPSVGEAAAAGDTTGAQSAPFPGNAPQRW